MKAGGELECRGVRTIMQPHGQTGANEGHGRAATLEQKLEAVVRLADTRFVLLTAGAHPPVVSDGQ